LSVVVTPASWRITPDIGHRLCRRLHHLCIRRSGRRGDRTHTRLLRCSGTNRHEAESASRNHPRRSILFVVIAITIDKIWGIVAIIAPVVITDVVIDRVYHGRIIDPATLKAVLGSEIVEVSDGDVG